jgi:hypothetical protein
VADLSEDIVMALGVALVRKGVLDDMDIHDAAKLAEMDGRADLAHALRCIAVEAAADGGNSG